MCDHDQSSSSKEASLPGNAPLKHAARDIRPPRRDRVRPLTGPGTAVPDDDPKTPSSAPSEA